MEWLRPKLPITSIGATVGSAEAKRQLAPLASWLLAKGNPPAPQRQQDHSSHTLLYKANNPIKNPVHHFLPLYRKKRETGTVYIYSFLFEGSKLEKLLKSSSTLLVNLRSNHLPTNHNKKIRKNITNVRMGCVSNARKS